MTTFTPLNRLLFFVLVLALALTGSTGLLHAQSIVVMVNGEPITEFDIEQRAKLEVLVSHKQPARQEVIDTLINEKVKIKEGKKYGVAPTSSDVEQSYAQMASRMRLTSDQLTKTLESKGVRAETLKSRMKAEMVWSSLVRGRFKERLQVGEKDVMSAVQAQSGDKLQIEGFEYKMQPVVLIVPRGSPQATVDARRKEAEALRSRIQSCGEANSYFRSMQNGAIREMVTKSSADLPEALRKVLDDTPVGHLTPPEVTKQGIEMVVLCARQQTMIDTPKKREIREKMFVEKYETTSKNYLQEVRKAAMIEYR
ncbi:MAG: SurA N-terminal domain-containing protein [Bradyrhizobium sp.]|nr:SurA N-terminal domain-containing protein [Bradyrhizobium sp.]